MEDDGPVAEGGVGDAVAVVVLRRTAEGATGAGLSFVRWRVPGGAARNRGARPSSSPTFARTSASLTPRAAGPCTKASKLSHIHFSYAARWSTKTIGAMAQVKP